jgi:hypothetical protein
MRYLQTPVKLLFPVLLAFLLNATPGTSQNTLGFSPNVVSGWPANDTAYIGDTALVMGMLKNYSANMVFDSTSTLMFNGTVDTGSSPMPFSIQYPQQITILPQDSQPIFLSFIFDSSAIGAPQFHVGNNVVVVWPIGLGPGTFYPEDSLHLNVFIIDSTSGFGPDPRAGFFRIYPVPANGPLYITSYHPQYHITSVIIYDAFGREVYNGIPEGQTINTESWAPGLYTVQAALSNGTVSWYKIMRQ